MLFVIHIDVSITITSYKSLIIILFITNQIILGITIQCICIRLFFLSILNIILTFLSVFFSKTYNRTLVFK
jgi:hypothetical protein